MNYLGITLKLTITLVIASLLLVNCSKETGNSEEKTYDPRWESLTQHQIPEWLRDAKFGIYTHFGIYCETATRGNATWNAHAAYNDPESKAAQDFYEEYGKITKDFGYKDLIPKFKAEKFDAEKWAKLFKKAGAKFAGPVAEHHDGFAMWDTKYSKWNAANMGPETDVVGELEKAIKGEGMKFVTAFHHAANWGWFPVWDETKDCSNPKYSGLYGQNHPEVEIYPNKDFLDEWYNKLIEVIDKYEPDYMWFDFALDRIREDYVKKYVAYYYNHAAERNKDVVISYKHHDLPPGVGLFDLELGQQPHLTHYNWITDSSVDDQGAWGYIPGLKYKSVNRLVDNLVDRVSKNGFLLMNVGPKADGTIPEGAREALLGMGDWLDVNGEAIYGTRSWTKYGEGPTSVEGADEEAMFNEADLDYTAKDIRFTVQDNILYATVLKWPGDEVTIASLVPGDFEGYHLYPEDFKSITMLGDGQELDWDLDKEKGLTIQTPDQKPCKHAYVFKIVRKKRMDNIPGESK
ncbi:MAG: alpha-L-fucosidase [Bacteroidales bacterium]